MNNNISKKITIIFLSLIININYFFAQDIDSNKFTYKQICSSNYDFTNPIILLNDSIYFDGYIIFQIKKDMYHNNVYYGVNGKAYCFFIYFVKNINDLNFTYSTKFLYNYFTVWYSAVTLDDTSTESKFRNFWNKYYSKIRSDTSFKPFETLSLSTRIFNDKNVDFYEESKDEGFFIFKCSFCTAIIMHDVSNLIIDTSYKWPNNRFSNPINAQFFIPISKLLTFEPVDSKIMQEQYSFKKADWYPSNLY